MSNEIQLPDLFDVGAESVAAAEAAMDPSPKPPTDARVTTDKKGNVYKRWSEYLVIDGVSMSRSPKGHTCFLIVGKIRPSGDPTNKNVGKKVYTRLYLNFPTFQAKQLGQKVDEALDGMNNRSLGTLNTLLKATGYFPENPGLPAALLRMLFPMEDDPTKQSPLNGKVVVGELVESPNNGENARSDRQVQAESFLPAQA